VILTHLCSLTHWDTDLVSQAMRYIPRILEVLDEEPTNPDEIYNLILELQISRTDYALKTYICYLSERKKSFKFLPIEGLWTSRKSQEPHLILHLRGNFEPDDPEKFTNSEVGYLLAGPFTCAFSSASPTPDELEKSGLIPFLMSNFPKKEQEVICNFLLRNMFERN
jgi:hypothetical protein